ncbi:MAG TPA: MFS transporter [Candidatus Saccharimonadales bacterium]|nr:MFS transporter [Candidatus Saccharimonadales bacterium]
MSQTPPDSTATKSTSEAEDNYAVLRNRNYVLYLVGRSIASFGQQMLTVAIGWELYERTHSSLMLGMVGLIQMIPMIGLTLPAGHMADTWNRKHIILSMTLVSALASFGLTLTSIFQSHVAWIYGCLFAAGAARTFMWPSSSAFLPQLVPREQFAKAVTWNTGSFHLSSVAGPAIGGAILGWTHNAAVIFGFNTAAVLVCFTLLSLIQYERISTPREPMTLSRLLAGFHFVFESKIILGIITLDLFAVLLGGATALLPVFAKDILNAGPRGLGLLQAALPAGSLLCAILLAHRPPLQKAGRTLLWAVTGFGLATIVFGISKSFWLSFAMLFVCGATDNISVVVRHTLVQLLTPDEKRGRVSAVNSLFIGTSNELGGFESGFVAQLAGPVASVVSGGLGTILVVVAVAWLWPEIRKYGRLGGPAA